MCGGKGCIITKCVYVRAQIKQCTIEFNAKINSVTASESTSMTSNAGSSGGGFNFWFAASSSRSSYSNQKTEKNSNKEEREFSMRIVIKAKQDEMPVGLKKVLDMLEEAIMIETRRK